MSEQLVSHKNGDVTICVSHVGKYFRIYKDKNHTFKDRILNHKRNHYELNKVLDDISFSAYRGEAVGLIGHNGCGKSTTLKLLNRILYPDSGTIEMKGRVSSLIELGAGFHPDMTGRENIYINASIFGLKKKEIDARLEKIIRFSELEEFIDNPVRTYSSGMYMRLAFSIAINVDADILLIDEILAVGDANFQKKCFAKLAKIKKQGTTIVIVSHSMDQIKSICDRVIWLDAGKIRGEGDAYQVCDDYLTAMNDAAQARLRMEKSEISNIEIEDPNIQYPVCKVSKQAAANARRCGSMEARFTSIKLMDANNSPCGMFKYGDSIKISFEIESNENIYGNIIFNIISKDGTWLSSVDSYAQYETYLNLHKDGNGVILLECIPLGEGDYVLEAVLRGQGGEDFDCLTHFIDFHVTTECSFGTKLVAIKNSWKMENI